MKPYEQIGVRFAECLMEGKTAEAHAMLDAALAATFTTESLEESFRSMWSGYASGSPRRIFFEEEFSTTEWPQKNENDVGSVYVGIEGDDFVEAITVVISEFDHHLLIREIEWGRP